jgi:hypothetical protein
MQKLLTRALIAGAVACSTPAIVCADVTSTFNADLDGWGAISDIGGDISGSITFESTGGNPGGLIRINDAAIGGTIYWTAPSKFLGDQSGSLGLNLTFDLSVVYTNSADIFDGNTNQFDADVVLEGNGLTLYYTVAGNPPAPSGAWTPYTVPLTAGSWTKTTVTGSAPSASEFASVLGALTALRIRAEFQNGQESDYLDNVVLQAVPEASQIVMIAVVTCSIVATRLSWRTTRR